MCKELALISPILVIYSFYTFNAATYGVDHVIGRSADTRLQSAWYGSGSTLKQDALKIAVEMAEAA